jgi:hypothetical protein
MDKINNPKTSTDLKGMLASLTNFFEDLFLKKAPAMPNNIKEIIVKYGPYITIVILLLSLPAVLLLLGIGAALTPFGYAARSGITLASIFLVITLVMEGLSIPGLIARKVAGWNWAYWAVLVNIIYNVFSFRIFEALISGVIGLWVLFQIRSYYK